MDILGHIAYTEYNGITNNCNQGKSCLSLWQDDMRLAVSRNGQKKRFPYKITFAKGEFGVFLCPVFIRRIRRINIRSICQSESDMHAMSRLSVV